MGHHLSSNGVLIKIKDHSTAGTATITSIAVDTRGYGGALFFTSFGTAAADNYIKVQQSSDDGSADDYTDLSGSQVVSGASPSNEDLYYDVYKPGKRYLKLLAVPTTSSTVESMWVFLYHPNIAGANLGIVSGTLSGEAAQEPIEGTA